MIRDISTAPTDGTRILVYVPAKLYDEYGNTHLIKDGVDLNKYEKAISGWFTAWYEDGLWMTGLRHMTDSSGELDEPTFWMLLPEEQESDTEICQMCKLEYRKDENVHGLICDECAVKFYSSIGWE